MLTQQQVLEAIEKEEFMPCLDRRDFIRLSSFLPKEHWPKLGLEPKKPVNQTPGVVILTGTPLKDFMTEPNPVIEEAKFNPPEDVTPWTREEVLENLKNDVAFGFEKALNHRGLSSAMMYSVVLMWMWILEDELYAQFKDGNSYEMYGLPLFKAAAVKYGLPNPIGDDTGSESKYGGD